MSDRVELAAMGHRARQRIDAAWSHDRMGEQLESALEQAIDRTRTTPWRAKTSVLARALAATSAYAVCLGLYNEVAATGAIQVQELERLGYDHLGRPLRSRGDDSNGDSATHRPLPRPDDCNDPEALRDHIAWLQTEVGARDREVGWLHSEVAARDALVAELHREVAVRDHEIARLAGLA